MAKNIETMIKTGPDGEPIIGEDGEPETFTIHHGEKESSGFSKALFLALILFGLVLGFLYLMVKLGVLK